MSTRTKERHEKCDMCDKGYPRRSHQDQTKAINAAEAWNEKYPVGTPVIYEEVIGVTGEIHTKTRSGCWVASLKPIVMIEGKSGGCSIDHMKVIE